MRKPFHAFYFYYSHYWHSNLYCMDMLLQKKSFCYHQQHKFCSTLYFQNQICYPRYLINIMSGVIQFDIKCRYCMFSIKFQVSLTSNNANTSVWTIGNGIYFNVIGWQKSSSSMTVSNPPVIVNLVIERLIVLYLIVLYKSISN